MLHVFLSMVFIAVVTKWIVFETKHTVSLTRHIFWVLAAFAAQLLASILSLAIGGKTGNFVLHSVGGGAASTLLFFYLIKTFGIKVSWRVQIVLLFAFVASLGALNELVEYAIESWLGIIMSFDSHDTWRDLVANTSGAYLCWAMIKFLLPEHDGARKIKS